MPTVLKEGGVLDVERHQSPTTCFVQQRVVGDFLEVHDPHDSGLVVVVAVSGIDQRPQRLVELIGFMTKAPMTNTAERTMRAEAVVLVFLVVLHQERPLLAEFFGCLVGVDRLHDTTIQTFSVLCGLEFVAVVAGRQLLDDTSNIFLENGHVQVLFTSGFVDEFSRRHLGFVFCHLGLNTNAVPLRTWCVRRDFDGLRVVVNGLDLRLGINGLDRISNRNFRRRLLVPKGRCRIRGVGCWILGFRCLGIRYHRSFLVRRGIRKLWVGCLVLGIRFGC